MNPLLENSKNKNPQLKCYCCNQWGHIAYRCPFINIYICQLCDINGHIELTCILKCKLCSSFPYHCYRNCTNINRFKWIGMHFDETVTTCGYCYDTDQDCGVVVFDRSKQIEYKICDRCVNIIRKNFNLNFF